MARYISEFDQKWVEILLGFFRVSRMKKPGMRFWIIWRKIRGVRATPLS